MPFIDPEERRQFIDLLRGQQPPAPEPKPKPSEPKPNITLYQPMDIWIIRPGQKLPANTVTVPVPQSGIILAFRLF